ncbi:MAG TPA: hypothetical protein VNI01_01320, partial [Elusimicrobiota bacterium]|nr:hypothetical protein [Elusimicrobiota bacterium]
GLLRSAETNFNRGAEGVRLFEIGTSYRANPDGSVSERVSVSGILAGLWPAGPDWSAARREPALHDVQAAVEALARPSSVAWKADPQPGARYHPKAWLDALVRGKSAGRAGLLHPELLKRWGLRCARAAAFRLYLDVLGVPPAPRFSPFSAFPAVSRDLSILVPAGATYGEARACVEKALRADAELSARVELSDLYAGERIPEGMKSFTFRLTFSRPDRTLKDAEVAAAMERALKALAAQLGAVLR